jgi:Holliday junction DNA helicase RuvA
MIVSLRGHLLECHPLYAVIESHGTGYGVHIPLRVSQQLGTPGSEVFLYTRAVYREDSADLYGFLHPGERDFFDQLLRVSGIGPRTALTLLSKVDPDQLRASIAAGDTTALAKAPGIGKKTAERLVLELKDAVAGGTGTGLPPAGGETTATGTPRGPAGEAVAALITLGYRAAEAQKAVDRALQQNGEGLSTEELVRASLR